MKYPDEVVLDQYRMLRAEIVSLIDETRKIEVQVLGAIGAFYAWLVIHPEIEKNVWYLASALAIFGGMRSLGLFVRMGNISTYMRRIEKDWGPLFGADWKGWETHFLGDKPWWWPFPTRSNHFPLSLVTFGFWTVLVIGTLCAPCWFRPKPQCPKPAEAVRIEVVKPIPVSIGGTTQAR